MILLHYRQTITDGLPHGLAAKLFFSELVEFLFQLLCGEFLLLSLRSCCYWRVRCASLGCLLHVTHMLGEACVDSLHGPYVFGGDAKVEEVDLELSFGEVFDRDVFAVVISLLLLPLFVVMRALFVKGRASVNALASSEVSGLGFFFAAMWSLRNEPRVGAKTVGERYPSGRRDHITIARFDEGEASRNKCQPM